MTLPTRRPHTVAAPAAGLIGAALAALLPCAGTAPAAAAAAATATTATATATATTAARRPGDLDAARLQGADREPQNWFTLGRDKNGSYYSPLKDINDKNVGRLGFAWSHDLGAPQRGQEATPIVIDGVLYTSGTWGYVYALDAATGRELWRYDPKAAYQAARNPCCDLVNRGVAVWRGKVYVASVDGRLHALNAANGHKLWEADTITDHSLPYSSTGAPQIAGSVVVIGNSGSDMGRGGVRGYVSAYDLDSGALRWRFYTVPGAPGKPYENPELAAADKTWDASRKPEYKGGGTAWDGFAYDAQADLVYFGTANAAPYDLRQVGPTKLDALYTASIIALHAASGRLAWYYQTTPHDSWDYDAVQKLILADLTIDGAPHPVIMQASKNGFFYVLDRRSGALLSARNYTYVNWTTGIDLKTGRPVPSRQSDWYASPKSVYPSWAGGHTWNPMSYSAQSRLVYIPVVDMPAVWVDLLHNGGTVKYIEGFFTVNGIFPDTSYDAAELKRLYGPLPDLKSIKAERKVDPVRELIRAWDPIAQKTVWEHETSSGTRGYDGGIMSTAGNLVFQGRGSGALWVYEAVGACVNIRRGRGDAGGADFQLHGARFHNPIEDKKWRARRSCSGPSKSALRPCATASIRCRIASARDPTSPASRRPPLHQGRGRLGRHQHRILLHSSGIGRHPPAFRAHLGCGRRAQSARHDRSHPPVRRPRRRRTVVRRLACAVHGIARHAARPEPVRFGVRDAHLLQGDGPRRHCLRAAVLRRCGHCARAMPASTSSTSTARTPTCRCNFSRRITTSARTSTAARSRTARASGSRPWRRCAMRWAPTAPSRRASRSTPCTAMRASRSSATA
jgi:quinohemoprotein ethanol dehydrogenase